MKLTFLTVMFAALLFNASAFAAEPLAGTYQAIDSTDCNTSFGIISQVPVTVTANAASISLNPGTAWATIGFNVGHESNVYCPQSGFCFDEDQFSFDSSYSADKTQFTAIEHMVDVTTGTNTSVYVGEVVFALKGNVLTLTSNTDGQPEPVALSTCVLNKIK